MKNKNVKGKVKTGTYGLIASIMAASSAVAQEGDLPSSSDNKTTDLENIVVTGVRGNPRTVIESPTPIDVFSSEQLEQQGQTGLFESLRFLVPSLNLPQRSGGGTGTFIASAGLRGLNPDQTLVLVNGKRRHKTALINTSTGLFSGSAGVDLNMIPSSAIERIEVLRDGASAQYGSDAIAGVVNIILKDDSEGGKATVSTGENFDRGDGEFFSVALNNGFEFGDDGFINLSYDYKETKLSNRARTLALPEDGGKNLFLPLDDGSWDPREASVDRQVTKNFGNFPQQTSAFGLNAGTNIGEVALYTFATYANRSSDLTFTYRSAYDSRNIEEIFPRGFRPEEQIQEDDVEIITGIKGTHFDFDWDFSVSYGSNESSWYNTNGLNASLGAASPTSFFLGEMNADEMIAQLDATRAVSLDNSDLQVSFGMQFRKESFEIIKGELLSYADGNNGLAPGAQGFPGFEPEAENDVSRNNINAYIDLAWDATDKLFIAGALRYEDFNDSAGEEVLGKLNARYEINDSVALRSSVSTGFRAPSIQQLGFRGSRGQFTDLDNDGIAETIVLRQTLPPTDLAASALGAAPLTPETSVNFSAGISYTPAKNMSFTIDVYQIDVDDRIAQSSQFNRGDTRLASSGGTIGDEISALLDSAGFDASLGAVNYFTNAIDTRSKGVDLVATWTPEIDVGELTLSGAYNYNKVDVVSIDDNPEELSGLVLADGSQIEQFDRTRLGTYTDAVPDSKASLSANYRQDGWVLNLRATRFGEWTVVRSSEALDTTNEAKWIVNMEVGYQMESGVELFAGANNIFNTYPEERTENSLGTNFYDTYSPYGFTGGSWYARTSYAW
ncbi:TonB-dependent receptor, plug [Paraglaciecola sp. T6c]|uniref:TonB-dependent receptor plug domain-containing protein n=1 Tax=Pseudoalteromonas atlantica (strain T6c / ATCC BAA-1087) TaxID=3042615 RepID=UPI00005C5B18|nr:TonB-dependent receptor [Paraglaciecola sp. T6c]ABG39458.1 TonB-dependent receptor, plug [Paraglaciecola sp. T6c]